METKLITDMLNEAKWWLQKRLPSWNAKVGLELGTGLENFVEGGRIENPKFFGFWEIPHFPGLTTDGHRGRLIHGYIGGKEIFALEGRPHWHEGLDCEKVMFPIRFLSWLGVETFILTSASGTVNLSYKPGDIVLINDLLNFTGVDPLRGNHDKWLGKYFVDQSFPFSNGLQMHAIECAVQLGVDIHIGAVYAALSGPSFETPAMIKFLRNAGADVVGMSLFSQLAAIMQMEKRCMALSCATNLGAGIGGKIDHDANRHVGEQVSGPYTRLLKRIIETMPPL